MLVSKANLDLRDNYDKTALHYANKYKYIKIANILTKRMRKNRVEQLYTLFENNKIKLPDYYELPPELKMQIIGFLVH